ncbi:hypothetical protein B0T25DRAFT_81353 [Lasiosphaeria hispida]|uniref:Uncharacterized protein n=1 Tax=Lasiosphaeria hispida TaxID=260671 RepID=A0AAJ0HPT3_9PEZI|nr:hypothetical protein B0T25DRAFT_81353 [Lasiosphaeria hispida]
MRKLALECMKALRQPGLAGIRWLKNKIPDKRPSPRSNISPLERHKQDRQKLSSLQRRNQYQGISKAIYTPRRPLGHTTEEMEKADEIRDSDVSKGLRNAAITYLEFIHNDIGGMEMEDNQEVQSVKSIWSRNMHQAVGSMSAVVHKIGQGGDEECHEDTLKGLPVPILLNMLNNLTDRENSSPVETSGQTMERYLGGIILGQLDRVTARLEQLTEVPESLRNQVFEMAGLLSSTTRKLHERGGRHDDPTYHTIFFLSLIQSSLLFQRYIWKYERALGVLS